MIGEVPSLETYLAAVRVDVDGALDRLLPPADEEPKSLHAAMRFSTFAGGKRVRPTLVLLAGESLGARRDDLLSGAAALEMIHTFSLIHDDLPALDDDDLRRGRPTLHRRFDEATAILAGDALLNLGLVTLAVEPPGIDAERRRRAVSLVGEAVGTRGMIGGQMGDLEAESSRPEDPAATLEWIHQRKTGALLTAAISLGGLYAGAGPAEERLLARLGREIGLLFQIADDILDVEGDAAQLGKAVRKDAEASKLTYPGLHGLEESKRRLASVRDSALRILSELPDGGPLFQSLVHYLVDRDH